MKDGQVVLSVKECAAYLGISDTHLWNMIKLGRAPACYNISLGKKAAYWRFNKEDVDRWRIWSSRRHGRRYSSTLNVKRRGVQNETSGIYNGWRGCQNVARPASDHLQNGEVGQVAVY